MFNSNMGLEKVFLKTLVFTLILMVHLHSPSVLRSFKFENKNLLMALAYQSANSIPESRNHGCIDTQGLTNQHFMKCFNCLK